MKGRNCDARRVRPSPLVPTTARIARSSDTSSERHESRNQAESEGWDRGGAVMNILYLNVRGFLGETGRAIRACGHKLVLRSGCVEALASIRNAPFDALVIEHDNRDPQILNFTVEAHQSDPGLPIFVASTWSHDLLSAIEEFGRVAKDRGDDEAEFAATGQADSMSH